MKYVYIVCALILTCVVNQTLSGFTIKEYASIIADSKQTFKTHCVYIISPNILLKDHLRTQNVIKILSKKRVAAAVVDFDSMDETGRCDVSLSLNIVIADKTGVKSILRKHAQIPSYATWVVFLEESLDAFISELIIPYNCELLLVERLNEDTITLSEAYRVQEKMPMIRNVFGTWTPEKGIVRRVNGSLKERRSNLQGMVLRAGVRHTPPNLRVTYGTNKSLIVSGYFYDIWQVLETSLNFTTVFSTAENNRQGVSLGNGSWTGLNGMILRGEIDLSISDYTLGLERRKYFDYLLTLMAARNRIFIRRPTAVNLSWDNFLVPFSTTLWMALVGSILVLAIALNVIYNVGRYYGNEEAEGKPIINMSEALVYHYGLICQQGKHHEFTLSVIECKECPK